MEKILAVAIFVVMFALIIWDRFPRQWVTLGSESSGDMVLVFGLCMHDGGAIWETRISGNAFRRRRTTSAHTTSSVGKCPASMRLRPWVSKKSLYRRSLVTKVSHPWASAWGIYSPQAPPPTATRRTGRSAAAVSQAPAT